MCLFNGMMRQIYRILYRYNDNKPIMVNENQIFSGNHEMIKPE